MQITFDTSKITTGDKASDIYITFAAASADLTYTYKKDKKTHTESISFSGGSITVDGSTYGTSKAYCLADIQSNQLTLTSATSLVGFISYGSSKNIALLPVGQQPNFIDATTPRYSIFEISYDGTSGGADITNISQFGGSLKVAFLDSENTVQSYVANTLNTTKMFQALANSSGFTGDSSSDCVLLDDAGHFRRILGTNLFPNGATQNPYPTFNAYLQDLYTTYGDSKSIVHELTNLAPGQSAGGEGAYGIASLASPKNTAKITSGAAYNVDYHFTANVSKVEAPNTTDCPNGTYSITLKGHVNATLIGDHPNDIQSYQYDDLSIVIAADDIKNNDLYMTNFIYQAATTGTGIKVTDTGWEDLYNDFGKATVLANLLLKAAGDFAEGITCGFVGSTTTSNSNNKKTLGELTSYEWWKNPTLAYAPAQPKHPYYSVYGDVVSANSDGLNGNTFSRGGVYGSPYDDRFGLNLITPNSDTSTMSISLLDNGDLTPS